jgi:hypothetical protein
MSQNIIQFVKWQKRLLGVNLTFQGVEHRSSIKQKEETVAAVSSFRFAIFH